MYISLFKISYKIILFLLAPLIIYSSSTHVYAIEAIPRSSKGDVIISEISWAGSSLNKSTSPTFYDEWIEFYNTTDRDISLEGYTIYGIGGGTLGIPLQGNIGSHSYFLLTKITTPDLKSAIRAKSDQSSSKLSISNSGFDIILKEQNLEIDRVNASEKPFAGISIDSTKASMAKTDLKAESSNPSSWKTSNDRINFHSKVSNPGISCGVDFGTPKSDNFPGLTNPKIIQFEDTCFTSGELISANQATYLSIPKPLTGNELLRIPINFDTEASTHEIKLELSFKNEYLQTQDIGDIVLELDNEKSIKSGNISSSISGSSLGVFQIAKPEGVTKADLIFQSEVDDPTNILFDSISINKIPNIIDQKILESKELNTILAENKYDSSINKEVKYLSKARALDKEYITKDNFLAEHIDPKQNRAFQSIFSIKCTELNSDLKPNQIVAKIELWNQLTDFKKEKVVRAKDCAEGKYNDYDLRWVSEKSGSYSFDVVSYGKADLWLDKIRVDLYIQSFEESLGILDITNQYNIDIAQPVFINDSTESKKIIDYAPQYHCLNTLNCGIEIELNKIKYIDTKICDIYIYGSSDSTDTTSFIKLEHITSQDINADRQVVSLEIPTNGYSKVGFQIIQYPKTSFELSDIKLKPTAQPSLILGFKSFLKKDWKNIINLKTGDNDKGLTGSIVDIFTTEKLAEGSYIAKFTVKRREKYSSSNEALEIIAFDEFGKKIFERTIKENEIGFFKDTEISKAFTITTPSTLYTTIRFYGASKEAYSDVDISKPILIKK
jgi:hypothetical protein